MQNAEKLLRARYAKDQKARDFQQMVDCPDECIKAVGQSTNDGRVKVVVSQNVLVAFVKKEIEESEVLVKDLDEEKRLSHEELQTELLNLDQNLQEELQGLEQNYRERKQALERSHSERKQALDLKVPTMRESKLLNRSKALIRIVRRLFLSWKT